MIRFRRTCIVLVLMGAASLLLRRETVFPTLPVPPAGIHVKGEARIGSDGDFRVVVTIPKMDNSLTLDNEVLPCYLVVDVAGSGKVIQKKVITALSRYGEFGFGRLQYYEGGATFHLPRGEYIIELTSQETSAAVAARGATFSLEQEVGNPTDYYLRNMVGAWIAKAAFWGGMLGIIICEFKRPNQSSEPTLSSVMPPAGQESRPR
jgi:hypothetical protein